ALGVGPRRRVDDGDVRMVALLVERVETLLPAEPVDGLEAPGRYQPRARVRRYTLLRPLLQRGSERVVHRFLSDIEIAKETDERRQNAAGIVLREALDRLQH